MLADRVRAELIRIKHAARERERFIELSDEMKALCAVLDRGNKVKLPKRYAEGVDPQRTALPKSDYYPDDH